MPKEDIANSPDYRQKTPLDKMISNIQNPQTKDLAIQLRDQINIMEIIEAHRYTNNTPDYIIKQDSKKYNLAQKKVSNIRAVLNKQAPSILRKFDDAREKTQEELAQRQQKNESYAKQDEIQLGKLNRFKNLLDKQQQNIKKYNKVNTFWNRRYNKNKIALARNDYVLTQVEIDKRSKADQSLLLNTREERAKLENPPQKLIEAVAQYKKSHSKNPTSYDVKTRRRSTYATLDNLAQLANERSSNSNRSSASMSKRSDAVRE
ncbi:hypothetical protein ACJQ40_001570 [Enterococcus faecium]|nr:hypothetical protein [Enterococcus faecium]